MREVIESVRPTLVSRVSTGYVHPQAFTRVPAYHAHPLLLHTYKKPQGPALTVPGQRRWWDTSGPGFFSVGGRVNTRYGCDCEDVWGRLVRTRDLLEFPSSPLTLYERFPRRCISTVYEPWCIRKHMHVDVSTSKSDPPRRPQ